MSPRERLITLRIDQAAHDQLDADRRRFGTPISEQIRRAIAAWFEAGGMAGNVEGRLQTARKRAGTRKRA